MRRLVRYFVRGLVFGAPLAVTIYVCVRIFAAIDGWLGFSYPGLGFVVTILGVTLLGFLASTLVTTSLASAIDTAVNRLPFVRLLYSATKDLLNAFVGEHRRFDSPVIVRSDIGNQGSMLGFITQESLAGLGLAGHVTVYLPFSYSLSGRLVIYPVSQVTRLSAPSADVLAFIISGGVTDVPGPAPDQPTAIPAPNKSISPDSGTLKPPRG